MIRAMRRRKYRKAMEYWALRAVEIYALFGYSHPNVERALNHAKTFRRLWINQ